MPWDRLAEISGRGNYDISTVSKAVQNCVKDRLMQPGIASFIKAMHCLMDDHVNEEYFATGLVMPAPDAEGNPSIDQWKTQFYLALDTLLHDWCTHTALC